MTLTDNRFLMIAFEEYFYAMLEGKHMDSKYVRDKSYERYENELKAGSKQGDGR